MEQSNKSAKFGLIVDKDNKLYEANIIKEGGKSFLWVTDEYGVRRKCVPICADQIDTFKKCKTWKHDGGFLYGYQEDNNDPLWIMIDNVRREMVLISVDGWKSAPILHPGGIDSREFTTL